MLSREQAMDRVRPGLVDWKKVNKPKKSKPLIRFKKGENCTYAVKLGLELGFSLVGIGGGDILDGNKKLILGVSDRQRACGVLHLARIAHVVACRATQRCCGS